MKIFEAAKEKGTISAAILIESDEAAAFSCPEEAIEAAIRHYIADNGVASVVYTRCDSMEAKEDGSVKFSFQAAITPEVKLGQYKGLKLNCSFDSDIEQIALKAAADNAELTVPELVVERKLDTMVMEKKAEILESSSLNAVTDMNHILGRINEEKGSALSSEDVWQQAVEAAVSYTNSGSMGLSDFISSIGSVTTAGEDRIEEMINDRIYERQTTPPQILADAVFESFLKVNDTTLEGWRADNRQSALDSCRLDFVLDAIIDKENPDVSTEEFDAAISALSVQYQIPPDEIKSMVAPEVVEYQVKLGKVRQLIKETAVQK